jgi:Protein of unknown function (DUF1566)
MDQSTQPPRTARTKKLPTLPTSTTDQDGDIQAGKPLSYQDNGDGTITDLNTGLIWEKKSDDDSIHDKDTAYNWDNAFVVHVAGLNAASFAGHQDWRLPNVKELSSIVDYENVNPAVAGAFNDTCLFNCTVLTCSCTAPGNYWSSTTFANFPVLAWSVFSFTGSVPKHGMTFPLLSQQVVCPDSGKNPFLHVCGVASALLAHRWSATPNTRATTLASTMSRVRAVIIVPSSWKPREHVSWG